jgi:carbonic anhydrase
MHWGPNDETGSEHLVDGKSYAGEIHFVNWNTEAFSEPTKALYCENHKGLIVLGVLIKPGKENAEFQKIINALKEISLAGSKTQLKETIQLENLFPSNSIFRFFFVLLVGSNSGYFCLENTLNYWNYDGSLTTPPCTQAVQWVVFEEAVEVSSEQLEELRKLYTCSSPNECCSSNQMTMNYRPVCDLNDRKIYRSFK